MLLVDATVTVLVVAHNSTFTLTNYWMYPVLHPTRMCSKLLVHRSLCSVQPIHEEQTITDGVPQSIDIVKTAGGEEIAETVEGISRHSLSLTTSSSSSCEHIEKSPQSDAIAEAEADPETSDTGISIAESTRGNERQCAAERHNGTGPEPDSHRAVNSSRDLASETCLVTTEPDLQDGVMNLPPAAEPEG